MCLFSRTTDWQNIPKHGITVIFKLLFILHPRNDKKIISVKLVIQKLNLILTKSKINMEEGDAATAFY